MRLRKLLFTGLSLSFLGLSSCSDPAAPAQNSSRLSYFDVPGFIEQQAATLTRQQAGLQKTVQFRNEKPEAQSLNTVNWNETLQNFQETDLNKKALGDAYTTSINNQRTLYTRKPEVNAPIKSLEVITDAQKQVKMLRAVYEENNALFYNREVRELYTGPKAVLKRFRISGVQKVIFFDSIPYQVQAEVKISE